MGSHHSAPESESTEMPVIKQYKITHYPTVPGTIHIHKSPSVNSEMIGTAYYGDIYDVYKIINNDWLQIMFDMHIGYIKSRQENNIVAEEFYPPNSVPEIECRICCENILDQYVLLPCAHTKICKSCIDKLIICPVCRVHVEKSMRIYD